MHEGRCSASSVRIDLLLKLPRELRDEICADALQVSSPIELASPVLHYIPPVLRRSPPLLTEALEAFYTVNTFMLNLEASPMNFLVESTSAGVQPKDHIRQLVINCDERWTSITHPEEYEETHRTSVARRRWEKLYEIPHLQELTICMDKTRDDSLCTLDFGPVLYALNTEKPRFKFTFKLSFDSILRDYWNDPMWGQFGPVSDEPYQPMGYVDMSDLVAPATEEDAAFIQEHLESHWKEKRMPQNRSIKNGLLDESPADRRVLAKIYAIKEPALLRCLMAEHFKVYQGYKKKDSEKSQSL